LLSAGALYIRMTNIGADGLPVPADHREALINRANQLWHTDSSFKATPALASVLSARIIPDEGGETEFASPRLAWDRLPAKPGGCSLSSSGALRRMLRLEIE
jgi:alpha-ketoglutarate-dependent 2,4-dichlorophenoxyacetate dioxygenase